MLSFSLAFPPKTSVPLRMRITWQVLEAAKDAGDEMVIARPSGGRSR
jgi:hypothetical protein